MTHIKKMVLANSKIMLLKGSANKIFFLANMEEEQHIRTTHPIISNSIKNHRIGLHFQRLIINCYFQLGLGQPSHRLSMVTVCDRPHTTSVESNVVELLTEPFLPFTFYSFLSQAPKYV